MLSKPPFRPQETDASCVPACLRMVLSAFGVEVTEEWLCAACDCTVLGTDALKAVDAARQLGFTRSAKHTLTESELRAVVASGLFPIVFVSLLPLDGLHEVHALVVVEFAEQTVVVLDPLQGERHIPLQAFNAAWGMRWNLAILIER